MADFFGKVFASIVIGISSLFGGHAAPPSTPPTASSTQQAVAPETAATEKEATPTVKSTPATKTAPASNTQSPVSNTPTTQPVPVPVVTTTPAATPVEPTKPATPPLPKVKVTASPSTITYDGTTTISWTATDALSCTLDSSPVLLSVTGSQSVTPTDPKADWSKSNERTYTIACTGTGGSASGKATVTVQAWVPPAGFNVTNQCSFNYRQNWPCITGPGGWGCSEGSCGG